MKICLNPIINSPLLAGLFAGACVMFYLFLMTFSSSLPQMVLCSMAVGLFVYYVRGGRLLCDDSDSGSVMGSGSGGQNIPTQPVPTQEPERVMRGNTVSAYRL